ncbi:MAG TPA: amino acid ABC transporter permease [Actinomycetota bacterium]|nr:amino acid ABC transporter permease [Actinomycetota bacterium]
MGTGGDSGPSTHQFLLEEAEAPPRRPAPARKARAWRGRNLAISVASTVLLLGAVLAIFLTSPGSAQIRESFFQPEHLKRALVGSEFTPSVAAGFVTNIRLMLTAEVIILVLALFIAVIRGIPGPVFFPFRALAIGYVDLFRGTPLILVLFLVGFGLPALQLEVISTQSQFTYGVVALVLVYSAYVAEVYRAGIESIHVSQTAAARSLGLSRWQSLRYVVLPQAVRRVVPPLLNDFIGLQKDTALVAIIGLVEGVRSAQSYASRYFNFAGHVVAAILFVLMTIPLARFTDYLIERDRRKRQARGVR